MSVKDALTVKTGCIQRNGKEIFDHLGNKYSSIKEMCEHYGITPVIYSGRIREGWSIEDILTVKVGERKNETGWVSSEDHLGNKYKSKAEMCRAYNISREQFKDRIKNGWTLKDALTTPSNKKEYWDHLGNRYDTLTKMCEAYGITLATYINRIKYGYSLKEALTITPIKRIKTGDQTWLKCGLKATITKIDGNKISIEYEDGVKAVIARSTWTTNSFAHPKLRLHKKCLYNGFEAVSCTDSGTDVYYKSRCTICNFKRILTPKQMVEHSKGHTND